MHKIIVILLALSCIGYADSNESTQIGKLNDRIEMLERKQRSLENVESSKERMVGSRLDKLEDDIEQAGFGLFVSAAFCSLWAMYTRRSSVLWFFLGLILAPFALIALLWKSSSDLNSGRMRYWG